MRYNKLKSWVIPFGLLLFAIGKDENRNVAAQKQFRKRVARVAGKVEEPREMVDIEPRIVGGTAADGSNYPWYAIPINARGLCGASLVHEDILVSAAHCSGIFEGNEVALGASRRTGTDALETILVEKELVNPDFSYNTLLNDVMVMKLASPSSANAILLNNDASVPTPGSLVRVIGFGAMESGGSPSSTLQKVDLEVVDYDTCYNAYYQPFWGSNIVDSKMICAGAPSSQAAADSCQGDSGGPLFVNTSSNQPTLSGIVSFGAGCGSQGIPGVYTRVSGVLDFIRAAICDLSANPPSYCSGGNDNGTVSGSPSPVTNSVASGVPTPAPQQPQIDSGSSPPNADQCTLGCTFAWVFEGVVLHQTTGSSCANYCALLFVDSYLANGYECGLCPS